MRPVVTVMALALVGCSDGVRLEDGFHGSGSINLWGNFGDDRLAEAYTPGAMFDVRAVGRDGLIPRLSFESDNPDVLTLGPGALDDDGRLVAQASALAAGEALVSVVDDGGRVRESAAFVVGAPDSLEIFPVARQVAQDQTPDPTPRVVVGGSADLEVRLMDGDVVLAGSAFPTLATDAGLGVENGSYRSDNQHDVVLASPTQAGVFGVSFSVGGTPFSFDVEGVAVADVAGLTGECQDEGEVVDDTLYCVVQAVDGSGESVWGVAPSWTADGQTVEERGDMISYLWNPDVSTTLVGSFDDDEVTVIIPGTLETVGSTNDAVACSALPAGALWLGLVAFAPVVSRRRRSMGPLP